VQGKKNTKNPPGKGYNLSLTKLKYVGADHDGMTKSEFKSKFEKSVGGTKQNVKKEPNRRRTYHLLILKTKGASILFL